MLSDRIVTSFSHQLLTAGLGENAVEVSTQDRLPALSTTCERESLHRHKSATGPAELLENLTASHMKISLRVHLSAGKSDIPWNQGWR